MAEWYGNEPGSNIDPYKLCLPNVTISEVVKPANNNAESDSEDMNGDFYIHAVPEVMISDDTERTDFFEKLNMGHKKRMVSTDGPKCSAMGCCNTSSKNRKGPKRKHFFPFPTEKELVVEWAEKAGLFDSVESIIANPDSYWLCSDHFERSMFADPDVGSELVPNAVPYECVKLTPLDSEAAQTTRRYAPVTAQCPDCGRTFRDKFNLKKHMTKLNKCTDLPNKRQRKSTDQNIPPSVSPVFENAYGGEEMTSGMMPSTPTDLASTPSNTPKSKKPRVTCHICGKSLGDAWKLKRHLSSLNKCVSRTWKCGSCEEEYRTELELLSHILTHPEEEQGKARDGMVYAERGTPKPTTFPCLLCGTVFNDKWKLLRHNQRKLKCTAPKGEFHCSECGEIYLKRAEWRQHVSEKHTEEILTGTPMINGETEDFSEPEEEKSHNGPDADNKIEVWTCSVCRAIFSRLYHLKRHCGSVHRQMDWSSVDWQKFSEKMDHVEGQMKMEAGMVLPPEEESARQTNGIVIKNGFECSLCSKKFSRRDHLKRHNDQFHADGSVILKKHICDVCDHHARDAWSLKKHKKSHYTPSSAKLKRSWQCSLCGVYLSKTADLDVHMSKHKPGDGEIIENPFRPPIKLKIKLEKSAQDLLSNNQQGPIDAGVRVKGEQESETEEGLKSEVESDDAENSELWQGKNEVESGNDDAENWEWWRGKNKRESGNGEAVENAESWERRGEVVSGEEGAEWQGNDGKGAAHYVNYASDSEYDSDNDYSGLVECEVEAQGN